MIEVKYVELAKQNKIFNINYKKIFNDFINSGNYILGKKVESFEKYFASYIGCKYAVGVSSGTAALYLALKSIKLKKNHEVITVSNSYLASVSAISLAGGKIVFADIDKSNFNISVESIKKKINKNTKAIIVVHLTGRPAEINEIKKLAKKSKITVIEDCAQAVGAEFSNKKVGSFGDFGCFSFHPLKNLSSFGDSGIITTNSKKKYEWLIKARNHGHPDRDNCDFFSHNLRMDAFHATILREKIRHIDKIIKKRRTNAKLYLKKLKNFVKFPTEDIRNFSVYHLMMIRVKNRDLLIDYLRKKNIETKIHYPIPTHLMNVLRKKTYSLKVTEKLSKEILSLPINESLNFKQINYVCDQIIKFYSGSKQLLLKN